MNDAFFSLHSSYLSSQLHQSWLKLLQQRRYILCDLNVTEFHITVKRRSVPQVLISLQGKFCVHILRLCILRDHIKRRRDRMRLHGFEEFDLREHAEGSDQHHYVSGFKPVEEDYQGFTGFDPL